MGPRCHFSFLILIIGLLVYCCDSTSGVSQALGPQRGGKDAEKAVTESMTTSTPIMATIMMTADPMPITIEDYLDSVFSRNLRGNGSDLFDSLIISKLKGHERTAVTVAIAVLSFLLLTSLMSLAGCCLYCFRDKNSKADHRINLESKSTPQLIIENEISSDESQSSEADNEEEGEEMFRQSDDEN